MIKYSVILVFILFGLKDVYSAPCIDRCYFDQLNSKGCFNENNITYKGSLMKGGPTKLLFDDVIIEFEKQENTRFKRVLYSYNVLCKNEKKIISKIFLYIDQE